MGVEHSSQKATGLSTYRSPVYAPSIKFCLSHFQTARSKKNPETIEKIRHGHGCDIQIEQGFQMENI
jgi:hypothetical protein